MLPKTSSKNPVYHFNGLDYHFDRVFKYILTTLIIITKKYSQCNLILNNGVDGVVSRWVYRKYWISSTTFYLNSPPSAWWQLFKLMIVASEMGIKKYPTATPWFPCTIIQKCLHCRIRTHIDQRSVRTRYRSAITLLELWKFNKYLYDNVPN